METYHLKRYHRAAPSATTGALADEVTFTVENQSEAEMAARNIFRSGVAPMDWARDFASLENASGQVVAHWLSETAIA
jgi:hypothetical protein